MLASWHRALFLIVMLLPFLGQSVPYPGGIPLFLPFAALLLPATVLLRLANKGWSSFVLGDTFFMMLVIVLLLSYAYGIILSTDFPGISLLRDAVTGIVAMSMVFTVANSDWSASERDKMVAAIAWGLFLTGIFVGTLGAIKLWLFVSRGQMLEFVAAASSGTYPWGTSLVSDYNFFALTILTSILAGIFLCMQRGPIGQVILALAIAALIVVGFLAGSRRFWVAAPVFISLQVAWMVYSAGFRRHVPLLGTILLLLLAAPVVILARSEQELGQLLTSGWNLQYRLSTLLDSSTGFGLGDRFELWYLAAERLTGAVPWVGSGFDYMRWFSCEFGDCSGDGYPHMPVLSAYLYGGMIAGAAVIVLYIYTIVAGVRLMSFGRAMGWLLFPLMAAFFFAAISANGPLSIRAHVLLGALCVGFLHAELVRAGKTASQAANGGRLVTA